MSTKIWANPEYVIYVYNDVMLMNEEVTRNNLRLILKEKKPRAHSIYREKIKTNFQF